jgi:phosphatidylglycerophosphatase A
MGLGHLPVAPGTWGSLPGLLLYGLLWRLDGPWLALGGACLVTVVGSWAAAAAEAHFGRKDPHPVVVDEIAGQMVSLLFLEPSVRALIAAFVLFRLLDVIKPFPCNKLQELPGASGIMADDLIAGLYANVVLHLLHWLRPAWF